MHELYVLNKLGQQILHSKSGELNDAIKTAKYCLAKEDDAKYAYIVETVIRTRENAVFFHINHKWLGSNV